jgi:hypothetical protein
MFAVPVRVELMREVLSGESSVTTNDLSSADCVRVAVKVTVFVTKFAPPSDTPPPATVPESSLTFAAFALSRTVKASGDPLKNRTWTVAALLPLQPERIELASIGSL